MMYKGVGDIPKHWRKLKELPCGVNDEGTETYFWDKDERRVVRVADLVQSYHDGWEERTVEMHHEEWYTIAQLLQSNKPKILRELKKRQYITEAHIDRAQSIIKAKEEMIKEKEKLEKPLGKILLEYGIGAWFSAIGVRLKHISGGK